MKTTEKKKKKTFLYALIVVAVLLIKLATGTFQPQDLEAITALTGQETAVSQDTKYPENHTIPRDMEKVTEPKIRRAPEPFEVKRAETVKEHISFEEKEEGLAVQMEFSSMMEVRSKHRIIGQLFQTYWLVEYEDRLFLIDQLILIFLKLPLDDLFHQIDGYIHIAADLLGTNDITLHRDRHFYLLPVLLNA